LKKKILFIVNPISGGKSKTFIPNLIDRYLDHQQYDASIIFSERIGHAYLLAKKAIENSTDVVTSVGGDGTINEVASAMALSGKVMGIIPCGSGNGLARTLKIPLNHIDAIKKINAANTLAIDCGVLNDKKFFNMAGLGFDAHISALFAKDKTRGLKGYLKSTFKEIYKYQPQNYRLEIDGNTYEQKAFMLSIANSSQYGNNVHISPKALVADGVLDVCLVKPFALYNFPNLGLRMLNKTIHNSVYVTIIKGQQIKIWREKPGAVHLDGEPFMMPAEISIAVNPLCLNLIV
jgi:YegS/Rv2252/BmrU family lipid kinase